MKQNTMPRDEYTKLRDELHQRNMDLLTQKNLIRNISPERTRLSNQLTESRINQTNAATIVYWSFAVVGLLAVSLIIMAILHPESLLATLPGGLGIGLYWLVISKHSNFKKWESDLEDNELLTAYQKGRILNGK